MKKPKLQHKYAYHLCAEEGACSGGEGYEWDAKAGL